MAVFQPNANWAHTLTITYTLSGSATAGTDYVDLGGGVTEAYIGDWTNVGAATIEIALNRDNLVEGDENIIVTLVSIEDGEVRWPPEFGGGPPSPYSAGVSVPAVVDDDPPVVTITATDANADEPAYSGGSADTGTFRLSRSGGNMAAALTVGYSLGGTTDSGDYTLTGSATFAANAGTTDITITPDFDGDVGEVAETLTMQLTGLGAPGNATITFAADREYITATNVTIDTTAGTGTAASEVIHHDADLPNAQALDYEIVNITPAPGSPAGTITLGNQQKFALGGKTLVDVVYNGPVLAGATVYTYAVKIRSTIDPQLTAQFIVTVIA